MYRYYRSRSGVGASRPASAAAEDVREFRGSDRSGRAAADRGWVWEESEEHVHEVQGSVQIAEIGEDAHNHRFATVTGEARQITWPWEGAEAEEAEGRRRRNHVHDVFFRTDNFEDHFHEFFGVTGPAIRVGDRHVHFLESVTRVADGHRHDFRFATMIEDPIGEDERR